MTDRRRVEHLAIARDPQANAAYLALTDVGPGEATETVPVHDRTGALIGALDLDADGCVLGIEFVDADRRLPRPFHGPEG
jgi:uncharacterized protein YuzE